ncbi:MAG: hypothetical protein ABIQ27_14075 [Flavobacterium sp.]|uniref:hypothetical protein n=1 Tax=Flavobacterium sp. TaxID=239 RepID=UPI003267C7E1
MKKTGLIIIGLITISAIITSMISTDTSEEKNIKVSGVVKSVSEGGVKDLVFELENEKTTYYINRGLENGFDLKKAKADYIGKNAIINYAKKWTVLAPFGTTCKPILQIKIDDSIIYSEWK